MADEVTTPATGGAVESPEVLPPLETGAPAAPVTPSEKPVSEQAPGEPAADKSGEDQQYKGKEKSHVNATERVQQAQRRQKPAERERDKALRRINDLERSIRPQNFDQLDFEARDSVRVREAVRQETAESTRAEAVRAEEERREALAEAWDARNEAFIEKLNAAEAANPGLFDRFASVPVTHEMAEFIAASDMSVEIANYLSMPANRREADHLARLTDPRGQPSREDLREADRIMSRIEARLSKAPQVRKATTAPNPGTTLNGTGAPANLSLAELAGKDDMAAYSARRKAAWKEGKS
jgi:hypothetical protein